MFTDILKSLLRKNWPVMILLFLAVLTRFLYLAYPAEVVFDEVHFGKFVSAYFTHQYYFDIHPPLGKLMIAGFAGAAGFNLGGREPEKIFSQIGGEINGRDLFILRFLPAFFGALFPVLIYFLAQIMNLSRKSAFLAGFLIIFDDAFLVQSKFILVDIFLLVFGFSALYFFLLFRRTSGRINTLFLTLSVLFAGLALSIKWTGLSFLGIILTWLLVDYFWSHRIDLKSLLLRAGFLILIPFFVYLLIFIIHLKILYKSGSGNAFMSSSFQKTLSGNSVSNPQKPLSLARRILELNQAMFKYNKNITSQHPFASKWYDWPMGEKPIWYWTKSDGSKTADIYLLPNYFIWITALFSGIKMLIILFRKKWRRKVPFLVYLLIFAFFVNLLPYILVSRATFLYHYLPALTFLILISAFLWDKFLYIPPNPEPKPYKKLRSETKKTSRKLFLGFPSWPRFFIYFSYLLVAVLVFAITSPFVYGFPLPYSLLEIYKKIIGL